MSRPFTWAREDANGMKSLTRCVGFVGAIWAIGVAMPLAAAEYRHQTPNFLVRASSPEIARQVGEAAEYFRREIARQWLGTELPNWSARCPIKVKVGQIGAGGQTTFNFHPVANGPAEVCDWNMEVQGSLERVLDSVIPHEVSHTIFACHFRRPLPRWADEGAATIVECESEKRRQVLTVEQVLKTRNRIPLKQLLAIKEYPQDHTAVMTLYAEGYSLAEWLVQQGGRPRFLQFLEQAHQQGWPAAIANCYQVDSVESLERQWQDWVLAGSPELPSRSENPVLVASAGPSAGRDRPGDPRGFTSPAVANSLGNPAAQGPDTGVTGSRGTADPLPRPSTDRSLARNTPTRPRPGSPAREAAPRVRGQSPSEPAETLPPRPVREPALLAQGNRLSAPNPARRSGAVRLGEPESGDDLALERDTTAETSRAGSAGLGLGEVEAADDERDARTVATRGGSRGNSPDTSREFPATGRSRRSADGDSLERDTLARGSELTDDGDLESAGGGPAVAAAARPRNSATKSASLARSRTGSGGDAAGVAPRRVSRVTRSEFPDDAWPAGRLPRR